MCHLQEIGLNFQSYRELRETTSANVSSQAQYTIPSWSYLAGNAFKNASDPTVLSGFSFERLRPAERFV